MPKPPAINIESGMLSTQEAAKLLGQDDSTLRRLRMERSGPPYVRYGPRSFRYPKDSLLAYAADRIRFPAMHGV